ncbi:putative adipose-regulatory protein-domain-containing protein [Chytridium lagenaria]|nr:putative adipose-regulatory protein-domain-containing protein [Chytridium lagenaria]
MSTQSSTSTSWASTIRLFMWIPTRKVLEAGITFLTRTLSSDKTQRSALGIIVFTCLLLGLLSISSLTYGLFYWLYIPRVAHLVPVYLQYPSLLPPEPNYAGMEALNIPYGVAGLMQKVEANSGLKVDQHYNLGLQLWVPSSTQNFDLDIECIKQAGKFYFYHHIMLKSTKVILKYKSPLLRTMSTVYTAVPLLFGTTTESQILNVPLIEDYAETKDFPAHHAIIRISTAKLQVYHTYITVEAHFQGLRYFMYHWSATTASVFISFFMFWYSMVGLVLWRMFVSWFQNAGVANVGKEAPTELWKKRAEEEVEPTDLHVGQELFQENYAAEATTSSDEDDEPREYDDRRYPYASLQTNEGNVLGNPVEPILIPGGASSMLSPTSPQLLSSDPFIMTGPASPTVLTSSPNRSTVPAMYRQPSNPVHLPGTVGSPALTATKMEGEVVRDVFDEDRGFKAQNA